MIGQCLGYLRAKADPDRISVTSNGSRVALSQQLPKFLSPWLKGVKLSAKFASETALTVTSITSTA